jgi:hypothetical protein
MRWLVSIKFKRRDIEHKDERKWSQEMEMEELLCCVFFCFGSFHFTVFIAVKSEKKSTEANTETNFRATI